MAEFFSTVPGRLASLSLAVIVASVTLAGAGQAGLGCIGVFLAMGLVIASLGFFEHR